MYPPVTYSSYDLEDIEKKISKLSKRIRDRTEEKEISIKMTVDISYHEEEDMWHGVVEVYDAEEG